MNKLVNAQNVPDAIRMLDYANISTFVPGLCALCGGPLRNIVRREMESDGLRLQAAARVD